MSTYDDEEYNDYLYAMHSEARAVSVGDLKHADPDALRAAALTYAKEQGWTPPERAKPALDRGDTPPRAVKKR